MKNSGQCRNFISNARSRFVTAALAFVVVLVATMVAAPSAQAQTETVLFNFGRRLSGKLTYPSSSLVADHAGNLYGSASCTAGHCWGGVFELNRHTAAGEPWAYSELYDFYHATGQTPSSLVFDTNGNLYGTGANGGIYPGFGVAFELSPGAFHDTETLLYSFQSKKDGWNPQSGLIFDGDGNLYGTTSQGGPTTFGTVFQLVPPTTGGGAWTRNIIHSFDANTTKNQYVGGFTPLGTLTRGPQGKLYGATFAGGRYQGGVIFELTPPATLYAPWVETVIYAFDAPGDGGGPSAVVIGKDGYLYGTTNYGGPNAAGTVFQLIPPSLKGGPWTENILYSFTGGADGGNPSFPVTLGKNGVLYGAISGVFSEPSNGIVYMLTPPASTGDPWTETVVHAFTGGSDGGRPAGGVLFLGGALYGTTALGGINDTGVVYEITF